MSPGYFQIISGSRRGLLANLARLGLSGLAVPYRLAVDLRNRAYDLGMLNTERIPVPVVSLGNLTTGGTGKTPVAAALALRLLQEGLKPAIVSRGYRADPSGKNDEALVLESLVPDAVQIRNPDRVEGARRAIEAGANVILLDDGFQHRRLHRDFNLLLIDALNPFGYDKLLPRGLLRESVRGVRRADLILLTRADLATAEQLSEIALRLKSPGRQVPVVKVSFLPDRLVNNSGETIPLADLSRQRTLAFCGIGNPEGFWRTLIESNASLSESQRLRFPDHHHYSQQDLDRIVRSAHDCGAEFLITTLKDLVKIQRDDIQGIPLYALGLEIQFNEGGELWQALVDRIIAAAGTAREVV